MSTRPPRTLLLALAPFAESALLVGPLAERRRARPEERITVATDAGVCELVDALGLAEAVWEVGASGLVAPGAVGVYRSAALFARARREKFDRVVDLFPKVQSMAASWLAVGGKAASDTSRYVDALFKTKQAVEKRVAPVERIAALLEVDVEHPTFELSPRPDADAWVERALAAIGYAGGSPVVVVHSSGGLGDSEFVELASRLRTAFGAWIVVLDTPKASGSAKTIGGAVGGSVLAVGAPTGARFVAAVERASLVVTDDTGAAYIAGLGHVPAVLVPRPGAVEIPARSDLRVVEAGGAYDAACELLSRHRTGSLFTRR